MDYNDILTDDAIMSGVMLMQSFSVYSLRVDKSKTLFVLKSLKKISTDNPRGLSHPILVMFLPHFFSTKKRDPHPKIVRFQLF